MTNLERQRANLAKESSSFNLEELFTLYIQAHNVF